VAASKTVKPGASAKAPGKKVKPDAGATTTTKAPRTKTPAATAPAKKRAAGSGTLVVVESPAKAATIKKYLGAGYVVKASVGHVKDLPKATMGIDVEHDFQPEYVVIEGKKKVIADIKAAAKKAGQVLLAPDPDREGEAIAWHIAEEIRSANPNIQRVLFNEITKKAVNEAILHPIEIDLWR
jgi:DNA topoisomerase-1